MSRSAGQTQITNMAAEAAFKEDSSTYLTLGDYIGSAWHATYNTSYPHGTTNFQVDYLYSVKNTNDSSYPVEDYNDPLPWSFSM